MARHVWSVLCSRSITDKETSQVSLLNVLESLTLTLEEGFPAGPDKPAVRFSTDLVSLWVRTDPNKPEQADCKLELVFPDGDVADLGTILVDLSKYKRARTAFRGEAFLLGGSGQYLYNLRVKKGNEWEHVASVPFEVEISVQEASAPKKATPKKKRRSSSK